MENKKVALVVAAAMVMVLISTFTVPLVLAADEAGRSDGGNGDLIAVESISRSNGGKGDSIASDRVNWASSNRKTLRSRLFLPRGYLPDSGLGCSHAGEFCSSIADCCKGCFCVWQIGTFCAGEC